MISLSQFLKITVFQQLTRCPPFIFVIDQHFGNNLLPLGTHMSNLMSEASALLSFKVNFHMRRVLSKVFQDFLSWSANNVVNFVDLIQLIVAWKQRAQG